jgi:hypothetical protein
MAARPPSTGPIPERIVLIGCAGSGKTTLARALAVRLGGRHIERDALGDDEAPGFALQVAAAIDAAGPRWVFDGAPYNAELIVYPHADTVLALDYPRWVVQRRVLARSIRLWLTHRGDGAHSSTSPPWRWWTLILPGLGGQVGVEFLVVVGGAVAQGGVQAAGVVEDDVVEQQPTGCGGGDVAGGVDGLVLEGGEKGLDMALSRALLRSPMEGTSPASVAVCSHCQEVN